MLASPPFSSFYIINYFFNMSAYFLTKNEVVYMFVYNGTKKKYMQSKLLFVLSFHFSIVILSSTDIQDIITSMAIAVSLFSSKAPSFCIPNQHFTKSSNRYTVLEFLCVCQLKIS